MGRSQETVGKKENEKKKQQKKREKEDRKEERKSNSSKGKSLEDMMVYLDENGNFTSTPPDPKMKREIRAEDLLTGPARKEDREQYEVVRKGVIKFFNEAKGYGFINDLQTQESVFVHINQISGPVKERDKVTFEVENGPKGRTAVRVKKV
ncbi:cold-shock protein [Chitinophagaceae bacterium MMS25-I14]